MADDRKALIGCLTDDPHRRPITGAEPRPCERCNRDVMLSPASLARLEEVECVLCMEQRREGWIEEPRNAAQRRELRDNGYEDAPLCFPPKGA